MFMVRFWRRQIDVSCRFRSASCLGDLSRCITLIGSDSKSIFLYTTKVAKNRAKGLFHFHFVVKRCVVVFMNSVFCIHDLSYLEIKSATKLFHPQTNPASLAKIHSILTLHIFCPNMSTWNLCLLSRVILRCALKPRLRQLSNQHETLANYITPPNGSCRLACKPLYCNRTLLMSTL